MTCPTAAENKAEINLTLFENSVCLLPTGFQYLAGCLAMQASLPPWTCGRCHSSYAAPGRTERAWHLESPRSSFPPIRRATDTGARMGTLDNSQLTKPASSVLSASSVRVNANRCAPKNSGGPLPGSGPAIFRGGASGDNCAVISRAPVRPGAAG